VAVESRLTVPSGFSVLNVAGRELARIRGRGTNEIAKGEVTENFSASLNGLDGPD